jgi:hypothetical protein
MTATPVRSLPGRWVVMAAAAGVALGYGLAVDPVALSASQVVYPLLWLAVSAAVLLWVVCPRLDAVDAVSVLAGAGYTLALFAVAGLLRPVGEAPGLAVYHGFPGWGPTFVLSGPVALTVVPFLAAGYATLGALAAVLVGRARQRSGTKAGAGAASGLLGLFACVGCTAPLLAAAAGALGAGSVSAALSGAQYPAATAAFLASVGGFALVLRSGD